MHMSVHKHIYMPTNNLEQHPLDPSQMHKHGLSLTQTHTHTHHLLSKVTLAPLPQSPSGFINPAICVCLFRTWSLLTQRSSTSCTLETRLDASLPRGSVPPGSEQTCCFIFSPPPSVILRCHKRPFAPEEPDLPPSGPIAEVSRSRPGWRSSKPDLPSALESVHHGVQMKETLAAYGVSD